jgi:hypothetical protein
VRPQPGQRPSENAMARLSCLWPPVTSADWFIAIAERGTLGERDELCCASRRPRGEGPYAARGVASRRELRQSDSSGPFWSSWTTRRDGRTAEALKRARAQVKTQVAGRFLEDVFHLGHAQPGRQGRIRQILRSHQPFFQPHRLPYLLPEGEATVAIGKALGTDFEQPSRDLRNI